MASLGNLTYNITVNDADLASIKEEIASLRATLLVQEAKLECQAEKFGKELGEHIAAKYKEMLAEQEAVDVASKANEIFLNKATHSKPSTVAGSVEGEGLDQHSIKESQFLVSAEGFFLNTKHNSRRECVCCGVGATRDTVQGGQVRTSNTLIKDGTIEPPQPFIVVNGETYISSTRLSGLGVTFQGGKGINGSVVVRSNDHKTSVQGWKFDNSNGDFELNSDTTKIKKTGDVVSVFDENGTLRTRIQL